MPCSGATGCLEMARAGLTSSWCFPTAVVAIYRYFKVRRWVLIVLLYSVHTDADESENDFNVSDIFVTLQWAINVTVYPSDMVSIEGQVNLCIYLCGYCCILGPHSAESAKVKKDSFCAHATNDWWCKTCENISHIFFVFLFYLATSCRSCVGIDPQRGTKARQGKVTSKKNYKNEPHTVNQFPASHKCNIWSHWPYQILTSFLPSSLLCFGSRKSLTLLLTFVQVLHS